MDCVFCNQQDIKERTIVSNTLAFAFLTYTPVLPWHTLIAPKRHVAAYGELTLEEREAMEALRSLLHTSLKEISKADGFNYAWNEGAAAGQEVMHLHLHVVPRKEGDSSVHDPKEHLYAWRPDRPEVPQEELLRMTKNIQATLPPN